MDLEFAIKKLKDSGYINYLVSGPRDTSTIIAWCCLYTTMYYLTASLQSKAYVKAISYTDYPSS